MSKLTRPICFERGSESTLISLKTSEPLCILWELSQLVPAQVDLCDRTHMRAREVWIPQRYQEFQTVARHVNLTNKHQEKNRANHVFL